LFEEKIRGMENLSKKRYIFVLISILVILGLVGCSSESSTQPNNSDTNTSNNSSESSSEKESKPVTVDLFAAPQGGSWYPLGVAIGKVWQDNADLVETVTVHPGGGVANVQAINNKQGHVGLAHSLAVVDGIDGKEPFTSPQDNVQMMAALYPYYLNIITTEGTGVTSIKDLKGKRIEIGKVGFTSDQMAKALLETEGMTLDDMGSVERLGFADAVEQLKDGHIDVIIRASPYPYALWIDLSQTSDMVMIDIPQDNIQKMTEINKGYLPGVIPAGSYTDMKTDVNTVFTTTTMVVGKQVEEELVYQMTKSLHENFADIQLVDKSAEAMKVEDLALDLNIEFHPGASRYWKEVGLKQ
jgi:TRAP transporter TAXI family solute receptor